MGAGALLMEPELMLQAQQVEQEPAGASQLPDLADGGELTEEQVVQMMESNPEMLQGLLQAITQQDPQAAMLAQQDPAGFIQFITQVLNQSRHEGGAVALQGEDSNPDDPNAMQVEMSSDELQAMFPHIPHLAILQTFKACGSDIATTANLLF